MTLASGEAHPAFTNERPITFGKLRDEFVSACGLCRGYDFRFARAGPGISNVLSNARGKQDGLLEDDGKLVAQIGQFVVPQIHTIKQDFSIRGIVETGQQIH